MPTNFAIAQGASAPSLTDIIQVNGTVTDLTSATVKFQMRLVTGAVLAIDKPASVISPGSSGKVQYDWVAADTATQGQYIGWWKVTFSTGKIQHSPEFSITIDAHEPGVSVTTGEIVEQARQHLPVTWDALSKDPRYGDRMLQTRVNYIKYKLFATVCPSSLEATTYNPLVLDYAAMNVALQIIPAGIDYWMSQYTSVGTTGTQESVSYPDRVAALEKSQEWLTLQIARLRPELEGAFVVRRRISYPKVGNGNDLRTPDPVKFPRQGDLGWGYDPNLTTLPWSPFT